jgi:AraC-like DNA-binding protein
MPVLPIPLIIALVLLAFLAHRVMTRETHVMLLALIAACAVQGIIIALVQYYGVTAVRPFQPLLASLIPAIAWLAFRQASGGMPKPRDLAIHSTGFLLALACLLLRPELLDILIPALFAAYGAAMLLRLARGEESLPHTRLESGSRPLLAWRIVAISLIVSAASDVLIAYYLAIGEKGVLLWVPSLVSSLTLFALGALSLSPATEGKRDEEDEESSVSPEDSEKQQSMVARLDDYVAAQKPFLDPDLTLARLARKLTVPAKQRSCAINRVKAENVSRYINRHRIDHACGLISEGKSVTEAMLASGFNTKSNFNREFLRVKGENPSKWLETQS